MLKNKIIKFYNLYIKPALEVRDLQNKLSLLEKENVEFKLLNKKLQTKINSFKLENEFENFWNDKKPKADIKYCGRVLPTTKETLEIDVKLFVQPNDFEIINDLEDNNLVVVDINKCDDTILKIYKFHQKKYYKYAYDQDTFGIPELWVFPHELRTLRKQGKSLDCDDFANSLASHYIAAGVPYWRVRCVAGECWGGGGHLTVYVLSDDMKTWVHTNSTSKTNVSKLTDLPHSNDSNDLIGIKNVWFSYNNTHAFHQFETSASKKSFKQIQDIEIEPTIE